MTIEYAKEADDPAISVVIPSVPAYDHGPTVACLDDQTIGEPYEVLVVNDGSIDRSEARNRGLRAAAAAIVALTDDDTRPPEEWLASIHREFHDDPELVCLEGPVYGGCRTSGHATMSAVTWRFAGTQHSRSADSVLHSRNGARMSSSAGAWNRPPRVSVGTASLSGCAIQLSRGRRSIRS